LVNFYRNFSIKIQPFSPIKYSVHLIHIVFGTCNNRAQKSLIIERVGDFGAEGRRFLNSCENNNITIQWRRDL
jgi:hypothetical protein